MSPINYQISKYNFLLLNKTTRKNWSTFVIRKCVNIQKNNVPIFLNKTYTTSLIIYYMIHNIQYFLKENIIV